MIYERLYRHALARIEAERAHELAVRCLRLAMAIPPVRWLARRLLLPRDPRLRVRAFGLDFPSPLGLAAGVDSNGTWFEELGLLGFGFVEVGTVTALPQDGNAGQRVVRLLADRAILNRRGFPNAGAARVAGRLSRPHGGLIVGVNIGKSAKAPLEDASGDYRASLAPLAPFASYVVLNVSSPNTPGLRELQSAQRLKQLVTEVRAELAARGLRVPLLVKIAPDLSDAAVDEVAELALDCQLDGIVAVNTTTNRDVLSGADPIPRDFVGGGISGPPLTRRALEVLRRLRWRVGEEVALISVGGIEDADDVLTRIGAGATLVQAHTAFVFGGPLWPSRVNRELSRRLREAGVGSLAELRATASSSPGAGESSGVAASGAQPPRALGAHPPG
ncbi:MAG: quinone-dependent dihydroorotate dehydrogenase [Solirubrobacteraceae bacterium]